MTALLLAAVLWLPADSPDPCSLVSPAEIAAALGVKPAPASKMGPTRDEESNADGAIWVAQKGKYMLNTTLAGQAGDGSKYRDQLKRLATIALAKL